mmetsp:Transcript_47059/g.135586  ORF Transcript_47059/g.135586 Transcript_47059/m.135586 type:complete len:248 (-) Transcript_47059:525-1268(-)
MCAPFLYSVNGGGFSSPRPQRVCQAQARKQPQKKKITAKPTMISSTGAREARMPSSSGSGLVSTSSGIAVVLGGGGLVVVKVVVVVFGGSGSSALSAHGMPAQAKNRIGSRGTGGGESPQQAIVPFSSMPQTRVGDTTICATLSLGSFGTFRPQHTTSSSNRLMPHTNSSEAWIDTIGEFRGVALMISSSPQQTGRDVPSSNAHTNQSRELTVTLLNRSTLYSGGGVGAQSQQLRLSCCLAVLTHAI